MKFDLVVRSARIVTPDGVVMGDLGVTAGLIAEIGQGIEAGTQEIDATGRLVFPGIVDAHVRFGAPVGDTVCADDVESGTRAAVFGGVTTVIDCTVQQPGESLLDSFERRRAGIAGRSYLDVGLHTSFSEFSLGNLAQVPEIVERGAASFKVTTAGGPPGGRLDDEGIVAVAHAVGRAGGLLMLHAENGDAVDYLSQHLRNQGRTDAGHFESGRPDLVEAEAIYRVATLARLADCPLYVTHLSSARGLEVIRRFRQEGWEIHAETGPHYLLLGDDCLSGEDGHRFITCPPLRRAADRQALTEAVNEGEIQVVASDHCPLRNAQKDAAPDDFSHTPPGLPGVETLFPLMFGHLVALGDGGLTPRSNASLILLARELAENPARLFGLAPAKGALREGADADFLIFDPNPIRRLRAMDMHGGGDWIPYEDFEVRGEIRSVYLRGERLVDGGQLYAAPGVGRYVPGRRAEGTEPGPG